MRLTRCLLLNAGAIGALSCLLPVGLASQAAWRAEPLAIPVSSTQAVASDAADLVRLLRDDVGVPVSYIASGAEAEVWIDVNQGTVGDALEQLTHQDSSLQYGFVDGRLVVFPNTVQYDRVFTLPGAIQGERLVVARQFVEALNAGDATFSDLLGPPMKGNPDASLYTDFIAMEGTNTILGHLVALLAGDLDLSFVIQPTGSGFPMLAFYDTSSDYVAPQVCDTCCPRSITYANEQALGCMGSCGARIVFDITGVVSDASCEGGQLTETVTTDQGCIPGGVTTGAGCPIGANNVIANCTDTYALCAAPAAFPMGTCTETYTQRLFVCGRLVQTVEIAFTVTRTATTCNGTVTRTVVGSAAPAQGAAIAYVLDRSGSMQGTPLANAKSAANQGITTMRLCDDLAVVSFSSSAGADLALRTITEDAVRVAARNAVNGISAGGATSIGAGLLAGCAQLTGSPSPSRDYVLLTDGMQNTPPTPQEALASPCFQTLGSPGGEGDSIHRIHTIGFGTGADQLLLSQLASETGGIFLFIPTQLDPLGLAELFFTIQSEISGEQRLGTVEGTIAAGDEEVFPFAISGDVSTQTVTLLWEDSGADLDLELLKPDGAVITAASVDDAAGISFVSGPGIEYFVLASPDVGSWSATIRGTSVSSSIGFALSLTAQSEITMDVSFQQSPSPPGLPILVSAELQESGAPVTGAVVTADVTVPTAITLGGGPTLMSVAGRGEEPSQPQLYPQMGPEGLVYVDGAGDVYYSGTTIELFDDGQHGDGAADDGVYSNAFAETDIAGTYTFRVQASGTSPGGVDFVRESLRSTAVAELACIVIDFDTDDAGTLVNGQIPSFSDLFSLSSEGLNEGPAAFDSSPGGANDPGPDPDLLVDLGNVLILQENAGRVASNIFRDPDDSVNGGKFIFDFPQPVLLESVDLIDLCPGPGSQYASVVLTDGSRRSRVYDVPGGWTTDVSVEGAGYGTLDLTTLNPQPGAFAEAEASEDAGFDPEGVRRLEVTLGSSGALDNLAICP